MENLIETLYFCAAQCNRCYIGCSRESDQAMFERCMTLDRECEDICRLTGQIVERHSENSHLFLKLCGLICEKCAAESEKHKEEHCMACADACRKCALMCIEDTHVN
jgi:hypothetical protein